MANKKITDLMSGTPVRDSLLESAIDISGTMDSRKVKAGLVADLASANVAAPYDTTVTYAIGQYCLYEGDIYRCIAITTGAFDSTAWVQIVVTGEFRRVVELTSAQYSALSSAEKNNGTLYILTDEETTAADIPYSAGVSVADKLATIDATDITLTPATGYTVNKISACRIDKMCVLSVDMLGNYTANTWNDVGTLNVIPTYSVFSCCVSNATADYAGMVNIHENDGLVRIYSKNALSNSRICFSVAFKCN